MIIFKQKVPSMIMQTNWSNQVKVVSMEVKNRLLKINTL